jgi:hypothetical protein
MIIEVIEEPTEVTERKDKEEIMMVVIEVEIDQEVKEEIMKRDLKENMIMNEKQKIM